MTTHLDHDWFSGGLSVSSEFDVACDLYQNQGQYANLGNLSVGGPTQFNDTVSLHADPVQGLEAATKRYVDNRGVGTEAQRLASDPTIKGMYWWATDTSRAWVCDGFGWIVIHEQWRDYVAANVGGLTLTGGNLTTMYRRRFGSCEVYASFLLGTGSGVGTDPRFDVPFPPWDLTDMEGASALLNHRNSTGGLARCPGMVYSPNADNGYSDVHFGAFNASGAYATVVPITATIPFTWGTNDYMTTQFTYRMATIRTSGSG